MLLQQIDKLVEETEVRRENADYLIERLQEIPGVDPAQLPENSRAVWHLFPMKYDSREFSGLSRSGFVRALGAEVIPCSQGYHEQYNDGILDEAIESRGFQRLFSPERLREYRASFSDLPGNRQVCATMIGLSQNLLLAPRSDMDHIIDAILKIKKHSDALANA